MPKQTFHLKVVSREGNVYEGEVISITSYNEQGKFDVLAQHANFISLIARGLDIAEINGNAKQINFDNALIRVKQNIVEVYLGVEGMAPANFVQYNKS
ncbi:MAG: ATP synthase F1, epsilon subunit [Microgenomates group bacterium GW2011_GWC1_37_8]|uniref:ATP synthase F1, epsilon subunit n=1 Tax=Candidatus Woesebacteria bacterium GW2011_GWB1_38_8 TaxID=1618570 RepID=A0A0G0P4T3_9BACT|nr:MAG: ATP synthase F1, epsilon subunit [Microgenomates group bacterium GW2011_GWC1_37_8]KKQ84321.1 MAG: ATP synthase F1, epsilon subunit [Candidatus Woesebacteria bacterium GW2011_GWB1_38_8]